MTEKQLESWSKRVQAAREFEHSPIQDSEDDAILAADAELKRLEDLIFNWFDGHGNAIVCFALRTEAEAIAKRKITESGNRMDGVTPNSQNGLESYAEK